MTRPIPRQAIQPWQIWWAELDPIQGHEQGGRRPVLIVSSRFHLDLTRSSLITVIPLTTRQRPGWHHHAPLTVAGRISYAVTEQIRTVAGARLRGTAPIATLTAATIAEIEPILSAMIAGSQIAGSQIAPSQIAAR